MVVPLCISAPRNVIDRFIIEPRRRHGEVVCLKKKKKKVVVVIDDAQTAAWKATWHNSEVSISI